MGVQAEWSGMRFEVTPSSVRPLASISGKRSVKVERNDEKDGEAATQTVALELMTLSVDYTVVRSAAGQDPRSVYGQWWMKVGEYAPFYLGGRAFMAELFMLKSADCSNLVVDSVGNVMSIDIKLEFEEYSEEPSGLKATTGKATTLRPGIYEQTAVSAVDVGPSERQRAGMMPANAGM